MLVAAYVWNDIQSNTFGYSSLYRTYMLNDPPEGFEYWHSWEQLYHITIIPMTLGVVALTHGWIAERRRRSYRANTVPD